MFLPENIDLAHSEEYNLSIRLAPDGFSFCIFSPTDPSIFHYQGTPLGNKLSHTDHIKKVIFDLGFFSLPFRKTSVTVVSPRYTLVPERYYDRKRIRDLFQYNFHQPGESVLADSSQEGAYHILFDLEEELHAFLARNLWNPRFLHHAGSLLRLFHSYPKDQDHKSCFVDFHDQNVTIISFSGEGLLSVNTFPAQIIHDTIFFIASVWEKLDFDQSADKLLLSGEITQHTATVEILKKLIRNVETVILDPRVMADEELLRQLPTDTLAMLCE